MAKPGGLPPISALAHVWLVPVAMFLCEGLIDLEGDGGVLQLVMMGVFLLGAPLVIGITAGRLMLDATPTLMVAGIGLAIYWAAVLWRVMVAYDAAGWLPVVVALAAGQISVAVSTAWAMLKLRDSGGPAGPVVKPPPAGNRPPPKKRPVAKGPRRKGKS